MRVDYLAIGSKNNIDLLKNMIIHELCKHSSIYIDLSGEVSEGLNWIMIRTVFGTDFNMVKDICIEALANYIALKYEKRFIYRLIHLNYASFSEADKDKISHMSSENLANDRQISESKCLSALKNKLYDYFENENRLIVDGFVMFRLEEYIETLENVLESSVEHLIGEKEYHEFIRLMQFFVDQQESKETVLHILFDSKKYRILNNKYEDITQKCLLDYINDLPIMNYDDVLLTTLITLAPQKLFLHKAHLFKNKELLQTIENIFLKNAMFCKSCDLCERNYQEGEGIIYKPVAEKHQNFTEIVKNDFLQ